MPSFSHKNKKYIPLHTTDESESDLEKSSDHSRTKKRRSIAIIVAWIVTIILLAVGALSYAQTQDHIISPALTQCQSPRVRQEWRSLSIEQQYDYINASLCLRHLPSKLHKGMALYDDFPFLHDVVGDYAHETAAFLTWHRYFIHIYESILRDGCGYRGSLPYWDWSLDWKDLSKSPVFQNNPGFGGDSHPNSLSSEEAIVGGDRCIDDGPWAGMVIHFWTQSAAPHCLSRGFQDVKPINEMGHYLSGEVLIQLHQQPDYESFFLMMEHGVHNAVQVAIGGDIMFNIAPYDPLFYLHHSQLDRLWWRWQQIHPSHQQQYLGLASNASDAPASLDDLIPMGDFAPAVPAKGLMNTESGMLCYRY